MGVGTVNTREAMNTSVTRRHGLRMILAPISLLVMSFASIVWMASTSVLRPLHYHPGAPGGALPAVDDAPQDGGISVLERFDGLDRDPSAALGLAFDDVSLFTDGAATLRGWFVPGSRSAKTAILTVHGAWLDRREFLSRLPSLHEAGYPVLLFDCRGHGTSDGARSGPSFGPREAADIVAAARWLRAERGFERVIVFGQSLGGAAAIVAAASDPAIDGVIAESAFARFGAIPGVPAFFASAVIRVVDWRAGVAQRIDPIDVVAKIAPRPLLLVHGSADRVTPASAAEALFDRAGEPRTLWLVPGGQHDRLAHDARDAYRATVLEFLARHAPLD